MRVLLVAPDSPGIQAVPEVNNLTAWHRVRVVSGTVTAQDLFEIAQHERRDVIHFACHANYDVVALSKVKQVAANNVVSERTETLSAEDVVKLARMFGAKLIFFNSCISSRLASYAVGHGIPYAIATNREVTNPEAWRQAIPFYRELARQMTEVGRDVERVDFALAFQRGDTGEGLFSFLASIVPQSQITPVLQELHSLRREVRRQSLTIRWLLAGHAASWMAMLAMLMWRL